MSLEAYDEAKFDIIGQTKFQQQWVPEFFEVKEPVTQIVVEIDEQGKVHSAIEEPNPHRYVNHDHKAKRKEKSWTQRAKLAGVYKKGMTEEEIKVALGFPVDKPT